MWFQTLKARQTIQRIVTNNSKGLFAAIEYSDRKTEVHSLKRETAPLTLDDGCCVGFLCHENEGMSLVAIGTCSKGRPMIEFRVWDVMTSLGFTAKEVVVQDVNKSHLNEGKFKALVNISDFLLGQANLKLDTIGSYLALAVRPGIVLLWHCIKMDVTISFELVTILKPSLMVQEISLIFPEKTSMPSIVVGEAGGVRIFTPAKFEHPDSTLLSESGDTKFVSTCLSFPSNDTLHVQEIQHVSLNTAILSDTDGCLWFMCKDSIKQICLPSSKNGHGIFAVFPNCFLATVHQNQTINLYRLSSVLSSVENGLTLQPKHIIFSNCQLSCLAFIEECVLAAGSSSNKTLSLWIGVDHVLRGKDC
ncbi:uncharacterized protein LOC116609355 [Nematostella vectensis]|uniref:uncharacterized protein LOC116609355 n=1 Tax=Nematostella vectensis TaxID=45351 RepID=UPI002076E92A|nr:uncharacterized protein LOC116609355 [Nematostella vectensis]